MSLILAENQAMFIKSFLPVIFLALLQPGNAQTLERRAFLGVRMETVTDDVQRIMQLPSRAGVLLNEVFPGSTAAATGWQRGDVWLMLNNDSLRTPGQAAELVGRYRAGAGFTYQLLRTGQLVKGEGKFTAYPNEQYADLDLTYSQVNSVAGTHRVILARAKNASGAMPAVLFLPGVGCYSLDSPFDTSRAELQLLNMLTRKGFVTMRIDRTGTGDSRGKPCSEISFEEELDAYVQAIRMLKHQPGVDSTQIYLIGHSMGGVMAPLASAQSQVKGIIAYGTIGSNFLEYFLKTRRTIAQAYDMTPAEADDFTKQCGECIGLYFVDHLTPEEANAKRPYCAELLDVFNTRARSFWDELYALNIPQAWSDFSGKALLLYGETDYVASREDHEIIAWALNHSHPHHAQMRIVPESTHGMERASTFSQARTQPGGYNPAVGTMILDWLKGTIAG